MRPREDILGDLDRLTQVETPDGRPARYSLDGREALALGVRLIVELLFVIVDHVAAVRVAQAPQAEAQVAPGAAEPPEAAQAPAAAVSEGLDSTPVVQAQAENTVPERAADEPLLAYCRRLLHLLNKAGDTITLDRGKTSKKWTAASVDAFVVARYKVANGIKDLGEPKLEELAKYLGDRLSTVYKDAAKAAGKK